MNLAGHSARNIHAWLFSFGDLLTLMLCFFVVLLLNSQKHTAPKEPLQIQTEVIQQKLGTSFALANEEKVVSFALSSFTDLNNLASESLHELISTLNHEQFNWDYVQISSCSMLSEGTSALSWFASLRRALLIKRQILDARRVNVDVRLLGTFCNLLSVQNAVSEVRFFRVNS